jgi:hypothetical protein
LLCIPTLLTGPVISGVATRLHPCDPPHNHVNISTRNNSDNLLSLTSSPGTFSRSIPNVHKRLLRNGTRPPQSLQPLMAPNNSLPMRSGSSRNNFVPPPSLLSHILAGMPSGLSAQMQRIWERYSYGYSSVGTGGTRIPRSLRHMERNWHWRRLLSLPHLFVAVWLVTLLWGERWVFQSAVKACQWGNWEDWVRMLACMVWPWGTRLTTGL